MKGKPLRAGDKINNYTVLKEAGYFEGGADLRKMWEVRCKCGKVKVKVNRYIRRSLNCGLDCGLRNKPLNSKDGRF